jgi:hypothetical protein
MAKMVLLAEFVSINAVDLSAYAKKAELTTNVEGKDVTTFASLGWKEVLGGLKSAGLALEFEQDFALGGLDQLMWAQLGNVVAFDVRASNAARSTSNPSYTGFVLVDSWNPITGSVGDDAKVSVSYPSSGAVSRLTA